jgi:hypothetical protein
LKYLQLLDPNVLPLIKFLLFKGGWGFVEPFPDNDKSKEYFDYVKDGGSCRDFDGIKTGGWKFEGSGY